MAKHMAKHGQIRWNHERDETLRQLVATHASKDEYAAAFPEATPTAIYARKRRLGLVSSRRRWSKAEDDTLREQVPRVGVDGVTLDGRTRAAIAVRAKILGLTKQASRKNAKWSEREDAIIVANYRTRDAEWDGWKRLGGRSWASIQQRASRLGVRKRPRAMFDEHERRVLMDAIESASHELRRSEDECMAQVAYMKRMGIWERYV